ncbi:DUF805 domain-containing protein [Nostocoides sp. F2B08]|uniref:DUF805 domain-containing protein n=1 Tax=Nostocoides sp. F2B08 TaxID=2653936 RepID=UPI001D03AEB1|nr:DUF805 domain-containing protein [Tetrasphaera sp. F2B08]
MNLRELRLERGWSQEELADASGVSVRTIQRVEGGRRPGRATAAALATSLGTEPAAIAARGLVDDDPSEPARAVSFPTAVERAATRWPDFEGRASRSEFWFALLAVGLLVGAATVLDERYGAVALLVCLVPLVAVATRRLRDAGHNPWWQLLALVPFGIVVPLWLMALPGKDPGDGSGGPTH